MRFSTSALAVSIISFALWAPSVFAVSAKSVLLDSQGTKLGVLTLSEVPGGVRISGKLRHLPSGIHAFHIHEKASCMPPDFKSAGGHFNPWGKKHGLKSPAGHHAGDLPNITVGKAGEVDIDVVAKDVTLSGGKASLLEGSGTAVVIHAGPDDGLSDPAGNAGARIACGPVRKEGK